MSEKIIEQTTWLFKRIERLIANDDSSSERYLEQLLKTTHSPFQKAYCLRYLGRFAVKRGDFESAEKYLKAALSIESEDPDILYLVGETATETGTWWFAILRYLEAIQNTKDETDILKIMRAIATAFERLNFGEVALCVLLGAYDRNPDDPFILSALEQFYEKKDEWFKAQEIGNRLIELIESKPDLELELEDTRRRLEEISKTLRAQIRAIGDEESVNSLTISSAKKNALVSMNFAPGLHTLVSVLGSQQRHGPILASAKALWAKSKEIRYDIYFSTPTLAAAIHWIVEKLHWRMPTAMQELELVYGVNREQVFAAVRILISQFQLSFFPDEEAKATLGPRELKKLREAQHSLFFVKENDLNDSVDGIVLNDDS